MAIEDRVNGVKRLLERVVTYHALVVANTLEPSTDADMQQVAKDACDDAKAEIDNIKAEIDDWT